MARACRCDISEEDEVEEAIMQAGRDFGPVTILENNAAVHFGSAGDQPVLVLRTEIRRKTCTVNLDGMFVATRRVLPDMIGAGRGSIINPVLAGRRSPG